jgi:hypothetical protein
MTYPTFRSKVQNTGTGATTSFASEPAGAALDDILWLYVVIAVGATGITNPSGWTQLYSITTSNAVTRLLWIRRGSSAPALQVTWTGSFYYDGAIGAWSNCKKTGNPYNTHAESGTTSRNPANPDCPAVTTTVPECLIVAFGMGWSGWVTTATPPSGYTLRHGETSNYDTGFAEKQLATATTEDPGAFADQGTGPNDVVEITVALERIAPALADDYTPHL